MKIIVDAMGGDHAPSATVLGAIAGSKEFGVEITLVGQGEAILKTLEEHNLSELPQGIEIAHASEVVEMCDDPTTVLRKKKDSSLVVGLNLLKEGQGDAFISAGNTGALLGGATLLVKRIPGVRRAALAPLIPSSDGQTLLLDAGANISCTPEYLYQFAFMGAVYAKEVLGRDKPRVGLINNGTEESKGTDLQLATLPLLKEAHAQGKINFIGNMESRDAMLGVADVLVTDGWTGNMILKTMEGVGKFVGAELKTMFYQNTGTKVAGLLMKKQMAELKSKMSSSSVGGTALLGVQKPVIKAHGSSSSTAIANAVKQARDFTNSAVIAQITEEMKTS